ncbi:oxidoreductase domain protein [Beutenbergia cavernae DSM 12333]|uniref:Oxidoreductase domain protein n=1 Tax=Beutenbergia cavernae (strain ATCC BAA-8 / DSM 12333 / CCUG 43141 / JCM 11478 / NBRC 16432 / NCIMB 13614 / HKI 0122) TaxID=471853 RepID=C5C523_BEUC1|nr:Gfo/Idh/MocA family oxidoreductase [Beutenbergia cavernae]ACQ82163.1 oxidoreductase domain protein [Beutenbergia cavernae DSM 12333]
MSLLPPEPTAPLDPGAGSFSIGIVGAGQFAGSFATLWNLHPNVSRLAVTDVIPERAKELAARFEGATVVDSYEEMLSSDVDAVAILTQRWTHGPLVVQALEAGKHVYSAVPMAVDLTEIERIIELVTETGLTYMMGETSYYNPATVYVRDRNRRGELGRVFYSEGDYVHDMDHGFYAAYQYSGGENWKSTASYPPMLYPTHAIGGVLGAIPTYATSVSCIGIEDDRGDGVFDRDVSMFDNSFSNMSALFELADGGVMRTNEFRRVGHYGGVHESRFRFYGTDLVMEQGSKGAHYTSRADGEYHDISDLFHTNEVQLSADSVTEGLDPALLESFTSGSARVHDRSRLPRTYDGAPNGHEGSHHYLADDFVRSVVTGTVPPVNAWLSARFTAPGIVAYQSALAGGERLDVPDFGEPPASA